MEKIRPQDEDTICALATPPGKSAIAVVRVSGSRAFKISKKLCSFLPEKPDTHRIYFGTLISFKDDLPVDEVLVSCFKEGRSFTGEESVEISCHGGSFIAGKILELLMLAGARPAERGEFSYRAFLNNRMDLMQAESVLSLIDSKSSSAHRQALRGLKGEISKDLKILEEKMLKLLAFIEAGIDFSDQDISLVSNEEQLKLLKQIQNLAQIWLKGFQQGEINRQGFNVLLMGASNAGKSSLFNCLAGENKAITFSQPGTTRDILSVKILLKQREFCLKDTPGFRKNPDPVEKKGFKKVLEEVKTSHLILFLLSAEPPVTEANFLGLKNVINFLISENNFKEKDLIQNFNCRFIFSKSDLLPVLKDRKKMEEKAKEVLKQVLEDTQAQKIITTKFESYWQKFFDPKSLWLSSKTKEGITVLKDILYKNSEIETGEIFLFNSRHLSAMNQIKNFLDKAESLLLENKSLEFIAFEVQEALKTLYKITGKEYNEQVIDQIFKEFCLGK